MRQAITIRRSGFGAGCAERQAARVGWDALWRPTSLAFAKRWDVKARPHLTPLPAAVMAVAAQGQGECVKGANLTVKHDRTTELPMMPRADGGCRRLPVGARFGRKLFQHVLRPVVSGVSAPH